MVWWSGGMQKNTDTDGDCASNDLNISFIENIELKHYMSLCQEFYSIFSIVEVTGVMAVTLIFNLSN